MIVFQDTQDLHNLQSIMKKDAQKSRFIQQYLKPLPHSGLCRILKNIKSKGFGALFIIQFLACLPLMGLYTIGGIFPSEYATFVLCKKDTFYRLKNNANIPWRKIMASITRRFLSLSAKRTASQIQDEKSGSSCFIFDDTDLSKTGEKIEGVSRIWSHVNHAYFLGFKGLFFGLWDGKSFLPTNFSLHREKGTKSDKPFGLTRKKIAQQFSKIRTENQAGYQRKEELDKKKTDMVQLFLGQ